MALLEVGKKPSKEWGGVRAGIGNGKGMGMGGNTL